MAYLTREDGRRTFGLDPENYDSARPDYPDGLYAVLRERCGLKPGTRVFEIGAGTGIATRRLIADGAAPLYAVEPDARLAAVLAARAPEARILHTSFERAGLKRASFDLGCAATAFHWLEPRMAYARIASLLAPGGWWAMWWHVFGDPGRPDPFHEATMGVLAGVKTGTDRNPVWKHPYGLDVAARLAEIEAAGAFQDAAFTRFDWTLVLSAAEVRALYATYSQFAALTETERNRRLDGIEAIAAQGFGGRVERHMVTALYTAQRR